MGRRSAARRVEELILFDEPRLEPQSTWLETRRGRWRSVGEDLYRDSGPANCGDLRKASEPDRILDPRASPLRPGGAPRFVLIRKGCNPVQVFVRDNDVNAAIRVLKKKMQREGTFREMKRRRSYEKPSERRVREKAEAVRRYRKAMRKRLEREGY
jgi:small subunit ribosomal protein S21